MPGTACNGGGDELRRRRFQSSAKRQLRRAIEKMERGQKEQQLTAVAVGFEAGSGRAGAERGGEADLRRPRRGKASGRRFGALPVT